MTNGSETERRFDRETRSRLDYIQGEYEAWARKTLYILGTIVLMVLIGAVISVYLYAKIIDTQDALKRARVEDCVDRNVRHMNTLEQLDNTLARAVANGTIDKSSVDEIRSQNQLLIDAMIPIRDCKKLSETLDG